MRSGWIGVAAGLALAAALPACAQRQFEYQAPRPTVPQLVGMSVAQARAALASKNLQLGRVTSTDRSPLAQTIVAQNPSAGTQVASGSLVSVTLGQPQQPPQPRQPQQPPATGPPVGATGYTAQPKQPRIVTMPGLTGMNLLTARILLALNSLLLGPVTGQTPGGAAQKIVYQNPQEGARVVAGTQVAVTLEQPQAQQQPQPPPTKKRLPQVPNLIGMTVPEAAAALAQNTLQLGAVVGQAKGQAALKIVAQTLPPFSFAKAGTAVGVTLEAPAQPQQPEGMFVPDLTGKTVAQASTLLRTFSLQLGTVTGETEGPVALTVVSQSPQPGTRVPLGTAVSVTLENPPPPRVKVPPLTGRTVEQAQETLGGVGLKLGTVAGEVQGPVAQKIVSQSPLVGTLVEPNTVVGVTLEELPQPPQPVQPTQPTQSAQPTQPLQPAQPTQPMQPQRPPQPTWHKVAWGVGLVLLGAGVGAFFRPKVPAQNLTGVTTTTTPTTVVPPTVVTMKPEPNVAQARTVMHIAPKIKLVVRLRGLPGPGVYDVRRETTIVSRKDGRA
jgi:beta-lactam-binding protein with PASTA domain